MGKIIPNKRNAKQMQRYKLKYFKRSEEEKKPWIYAYYALMLGTQKRNARIQREKFEAQKQAALLLEKEHAANQTDTAS